MPKFLQKLKKQKSRASPQRQLSASVGTQSEPLPTSYHLDALLSTSQQSSHEGGGSNERSYLGEDEADGMMLSSQLSLEERGRRSGDTQSFLPLHSAAAAPSPPPTSFTFPPSLEHHVSPYTNTTTPIYAFRTTPTHLPMATPTQQLSGDCSPSLPSPTFPLLPQQDKPSSTPVTPHTMEAVPPHTMEAGLSESARAVWDSTVAELRSTLGHMRRERGRGMSCCSDEEVGRCHRALQALQERERRLMSEVKAELQPPESQREEEEKRRRRKLQKTVSCPPISPHPETVVADLEKCLRQTEEAIQAVQGEREELREGVGWMEDELTSLKRSNSLLAKRKQQWMDVASETRVVLEENYNLMTQHKNQQRIMSELRTQHHSRVSALERELREKEDKARALELEMKKRMDGQAVLFHQVSRLVGVAVGGASSPRHVASVLEKYANDQSIERSAQQDTLLSLERENRSLAARVAEAKAVIKKQESEVTCVQSIVREGEEAVARLRGELEEVEEREETSQRQLAHAIAQVDKALEERDAYARMVSHGSVAKRWQRQAGSTSPTHTSRALEDVHHQLRQQAQEHKAQCKQYKIEIRRLRDIVATTQH